jgi:hypothetical protein
MADDEDQAAFARRLYSRLIDPSLTTAAEELDLPDTNTGTGELGDRLTERFAAPSRPNSIMIKVAGQDIGVSTPASVKAAAGSAGPVSDFGAAERSELPGRSSRYRVITFRCRKCHLESYHSYYDPRNIPQCEDEPMELVR